MLSLALRTLSPLSGARGGKSHKVMYVFRDQSVLKHARLYVSSFVYFLYGLKKYVLKTCSFICIFICLYVFSFIYT